MLKEIENLMQAVDCSLDYRIINLGGKSLYLEGIKSVVRLDSIEMIFQLKNCVAIIHGSDLKIKYLDKTTCVLNGKIELVETK